MEKDKDTKSSKDDNANAEILNPNCSEVVWRLEVPRNTKEKILKSLEGNKNSFETDTSIYPNGCLDDILRLLKGVEDFDSCSIEMIENVGGGGDIGYVEECFELGKRYKKGEITREEADKMVEEY